MIENIDMTALALIASSPVVANIITTIIGLVRTKLQGNKQISKMLEVVTVEKEKIQKSYDDIAVMKAKLESMEQYLLEKEKKNDK